MAGPAVDPPASAAAPGASAGGPPAARTIFAYSGFNKLFFGSLCGAFADRLYFTALIAAAYIVFARSSPEDYKGQIQIYATVPLLVFYGLAGPLVDSFDRRRLLALVKGSKAVLVLLFAPMLWRVVDLTPDNPDAALCGQMAGLWS